MNMDLVSLKIKEGGCDIYYVDDFSITLPNSVSLNEKIYFRFCDFIFIPDSTETLSQEQVIIVNQIRAKYFKIHPQFNINNTVRTIFQSMIEILNPKTILEFGPGSNPYMPEIHHDKQFYYADFNPSSIEALESLGLNCQLFDKESILNLPNESVDLIISIFVFQFDISQAQIDELFRVLDRNGYLLANMYKRSKDARNQLLDRFKLTGFSYSIVIDESNLCENHEYWVLFKIKNEETVNTLIEQINKRNY